jgi:large subunit ribosomal protein L17
MSSHRRRVRKFNRNSKTRLALFRGLMTSLVEHGRIKTTVVKAKEVKRHIEKLVTLGKKGDVASRRLIIARINNSAAAGVIVDDISKRMQSRPGGYTRVIKIGRRPGDTSEMAFIEFVDHDWAAKAKQSDDTGKAESKKAATPVKKAKKVISNDIIAKRKKAVKAKKKARTASRA